jgi:hypothetical protein
MRRDNCVYYVTVAIGRPDSGVHAEHFAWASAKDETKERDQDELLEYRPA